MSDLLPIEFSSEKKAEGVREILLTMRNEYLIELCDAIIAVKKPNDWIKLSQLFDPITQDAASETLWGSLIGLLSVIPVTAAAHSAAAGGQMADLGIDDEFMMQAGRTLQSGYAALFLLIRGMTTDKVLAALRRVPGTVMRSPFDETKEHVVHEALAQLRAIISETAGERLPLPRMRGVRKID